MMLICRLHYKKLIIKVDCEWDEWIIGECSKTCGGGFWNNFRDKNRIYRKDFKKFEEISPYNCGFNKIACFSSYRKMNLFTHMTFGSLICVISQIWLLDNRHKIKYEYGTCHKSYANSVIHGKIKEIYCSLFQHQAMEISESEKSSI